ncbi:MAG: vitamin K epoxide reductase family protein, partial [Chloroflexota bacterium]
MNTPVKNDSLFSARNLTFVFLALAIGISSYLSYLKFDTSASPACSVGAVFDCGTVLNSVYSEIGGVPIAYLGLATNLIVLALLILEPRVQFFTNFTVPLV